MKRWMLSGDTLFLRLATGDAMYPAQRQISVVSHSRPVTHLIISVFESGSVAGPIARVLLVTALAPLSHPPVIQM